MPPIARVHFIPRGKMDFSGIQDCLVDLKTIDYTLRKGDTEAHKYKGILILTLTIFFKIRGIIT